MAAQREIKAKQLIEDIRLRLTASELMQKYQLLPRELESVFRQLRKAIGSPGTLYGRSHVQGHAPDFDKIRLLPRNDVPLPVPVHDLNRLHLKALLTDITEKGLGVHGIEAQAGDVINFVVRADKFFPVNQFKVRAVCRWAGRSNESGEFAAGFEITDISSKNLDELRNFITSLNLINRVSRMESPTEVAEQTASAPRGPKPAWTCPFCGKSQPREYDECPQCGIIISRYVKQLDGVGDEIRVSVEAVAQDHAGPSIEQAGSDEAVTVEAELLVKQTVYVPARIWEQIQALGGDADDHVTRALEKYLEMRGGNRTAT